MTHGRAHLHELLNGGLDLVVKQASVGHDDDRVEDLFVIALQTDELVRRCESQEMDFALPLPAECWIR